VTPTTRTTTAPDRAAWPARVRPAPARLLTGALLAGFVLLVAALDPHSPGRYPRCPWHAVTGTWCPGCGGLRALHDLTHGHVATAAGENLLLVLLAPALALWWVVARVRGRRGQPLVLSPGGTVLVAVVAIGFAVVRNLPAGAALAP
jgi:hypothetical protein